MNGMVYTISAEPQISQFLILFREGKACSLRTI